MKPKFMKPKCRPCTLWIAIYGIRAKTQRQKLEKDFVEYKEFWFQKEINKYIALKMFIKHNRKLRKKLNRKLDKKIVGIFVHFK